ncbi:MAG: hypothetical protein ACYC6N_28970, partial [Pirellulaceae bacterium]
MIRTVLTIALVVTVALSAPAADRPETGKTPKPNVLPVSVLLEQMAKSSLGPGEAHLLRAVADLVEKEQVARSDGSTMGISEPVIATTPDSEALHAAQPTPAPTEETTRLVICLSYVPAVNAVKTLEKFLIDDQRSRVAGESVTNLKRVVLVPEPVSNSLLVSGCPEIIASLTELSA